MDPNVFNTMVRRRLNLSRRLLSRHLYNNTVDWFWQGSKVWMIEHGDHIDIREDGHLRQEVN